MKPIVLLSLLTLYAPLIGSDVRIHVTDDQGTPMEGAAATVAFTGYVRGTGAIHEHRTDRMGNFRVSGRAQHSVFVAVRKSGYYEARLESLPKDQDHDLTVVLPRVLNPRALFALDSRVGRAAPGVSFPEKNTWLGFDLEMGDLVAPWGSGKTVDLRFRFKNEFFGWDISDASLKAAREINQRASEEELRWLYGKWDAELEISFPGEKDGIFEESRFLEYSQLKLPHHAPEQGYGSTWRYTANTYSPPTTRGNVGFFLRTRARTNEKGEIVSAHYSKVMGDLKLIAAPGRVLFAYYFNPTPNDRNLEFDPKKNLFPPDRPGANVLDP